MQHQGYVVSKLHAINHLSRFRTVLHSSQIQVYSLML
jgi:hypothetical protein